VSDREHRRQHLFAFLRTIQKPDRPLEALGDDDSLVETGLIDSLAVLEIVAYLETYGIDFAEHGVEPEQLFSVGGILTVIEEGG
jgi:acyl carrier protein